MSNNAENQRIRLWKQNPHCFYCGIKTEYPLKRTRGKHKPETATIDHIYCKTHPKRLEMKGQPHPVVLACRKCNEEKNKAENAGDASKFINKYLNQKHLTK